MRRCVVFDLDGTLTRSEEGIWKSARHTCRVLNWPEPDQALLDQMIGPPLGWTFRHLMGMGDDLADEAVRVYKARYAEKGLFENRVYPGIRRLLRMLHRRGDWVAVATGKVQSTSERILRHFGLSPLIDRVVGAPDGTKAEKDSLILAALPEEWEEAWMVGDRRFDIEGGTALGIHTVGAGYGYGSEAELRAAGCEYYAPDVEDLIGILCPGEKAPEGFFLSIEGLDGSGKSTQIRLLTEALDRWGYEVQHSREPGGSPIGEKLREIILDRGNAEMCAETEALLYAAGRAQHVRQVIRPALRQGKVLLSDRFVDASVAYQGGGRGLGVEEVLRINRMAVDDEMPMLTVYLDIGHEAALRRRLSASMPDRIEAESDSFFARVEDAYRELIRRDPQRFVAVDASLPPDALGEITARQVLARLMEAETHG